MKISAQDEYGLRLLLRIARSSEEAGLNITQLSEAEGLSLSYVGKLTRTLRMAGFIHSNRGPKGGYVLAKAPEEININAVLKSLGGALFDEAFCGDHTGALRLCTNSVDCSVRSLWRVVQIAVDTILERVTLRDLMGSEESASNLLQQILDESILRTSLP